MSTSRAKRLASGNSTQNFMARVGTIIGKLSNSAGSLTLARIETSAQARSRLQADLFAIDRCLLAAEPGTERYRQLAAERRRIMLTLGPR